MTAILVRCQAEEWIIASLILSSTLGRPGFASFGLGRLSGASSSDRTHLRNVK